MNFTFIDVCKIFQLRIQCPSSLVSLLLLFLSHQPWKYKKKYFLVSSLVALVSTIIDIFFCLRYLLMRKILKEQLLTALSILSESNYFSRSHYFQVPFIAFYRKEYVEPELNINDLWRVWQFDEKVKKFAELNIPLVVFCLF